MLSASEFVAIGQVSACMPPRPRKVQVRLQCQRKHDSTCSGRALGAVAELLGGCQSVRYWLVGHWQLPPQS